jgi:hypothetical protein
MLRKTIECVANDAVATLYASLLKNLDENFGHFLAHVLLRTNQGCCWKLAQTSSMKLARFMRGDSVHLKSDVRLRYVGIGFTSRRLTIRHSSNQRGLFDALTVPTNTNV